MAQRIVVTSNELLEAIKAAREPEHPDAMTVREIMAALSISRDQVHAMLRKVGARQVTASRRNAAGQLRRVSAYVLK